MSAKNVKKDKQTKNKKRSTILFKLIMMSVLPTVCISLIIMILSTINLSNVMQNDAVETVRIEAGNFAEMYDGANSGQYHYMGGELFKGGTQITGNYTKMDAIKAESGFDLALYYEGKIVCTTIQDGSGNRYEGIDADPVVYEKVFGNGETYLDSNVVINGTTYIGCFMPIYEGNKIDRAGMTFAGVPVANIKSQITASVVKNIVVALVLLFIVIIIVSLFASALARDIKKLNGVVSTLSTGDLMVKVPAGILNRGDEIGTMANSLQELVDRLNGIISTIKKSADVIQAAGDSLDHMASQTSTTSDEISRAIDGIARGAVNQAEEIDEASTQIGCMEKDIVDIVNSAKKLNADSEQMKNASDASSKIMVELCESNDRTTDAIGRIAQQINVTNQSVQTIRQAVELIVDIADETSLLSLNASIEAARAGEQGRGFAVVASEIQKLAEQSNNSARIIEDVIDGLLKESDRTVEVMNEVQVIVKEQQQKLEETRNRFEVVINGVDSSRTGTSVIRGQAEVCDDVRVKVVDVFNSLSAISDQNTVSTEGTTVSMQKLNATINSMSQSAHDLMGLAERLQENISYFTIETL